MRRRVAGSSSRTRPSRTSSRPPSTRSGCSLALARNIPQAHSALVAGPLGAVEVGRRRARRQGARGARVRPDRPAGRPARSRLCRCRSSHTTRSSPPSDSVSSASRAARSTRCSPRADFLTLHLPLTDETRGSIDADAIAKMRDGVRLVNAARGELVDDDALVAALESGKVAGAAIDVFVAGAVRRAAAPRAEHRRDAASRRLDRRGAGPRRRDRRRAGRRGARRRSRHERRQHPDRRRGRPRGARAVHPARGEARAVGDGARRRRRAPADRRGARRARRATTRGC